MLHTSALLLALAPQAAGEPGGPGLALLAGKALTCAYEGDLVLEDPVLLVRDGQIEAIGSEGALEVPSDYVVEDLGDAWLTPGLIDLHSHVGGNRRDINDMVLQTNPGLRVAPAVIAGNDQLDAPLLNQLAGSTDHASVVMWPPALEGRPVFDYAAVRRPTWLGRLSDRIFGAASIAQTLTDDVAAHLAQRSST